MTAKFIKEQPELCDKEHVRFHNRHRKEALWPEPIDVKCWLKSQRTRYGKLAKQQAPKELT